jgi:hypothetical protein
VRTSLEVADIFRAVGPAYRAAQAGHLSLQQLKVMSAIEHCRTAALGGHVEACSYRRIAYNSCLMGKFSNGESACGSLRADLGWPPFFSHYCTSLADLSSSR